MKTTIVNVNIENEKAVVNYSTGTVREYPTDKLPKTVQTWIEEHNDSTQEEKEVETVAENTIETVHHEITVIPQLPAVVAREEKETANTESVKIPMYRLIPYTVLLIVAMITRQLSTVCYTIANIFQIAAAVNKRVKDIYMIYRYPVYEYIQYIRMQVQDSWAWREEIIRENRGAEE